MNLVLQKPGSSNCGQCCVAMLAGITRKESCKVFGTKGVTTTKYVVRALRKLGLSCADRLKPFRQPASLPPVCLLVLSYDARAYGHWVVYYHGQIYCPGRGIYPFDRLATMPGTKCTSYLTVTPA